MNKNKLKTVGLFEFNTQNKIKTIDMFDFYRAVFSVNALKL